jgi:hypothetical protein
MKRLLLVIVCLLGVWVYVTKPDDLGSGSAFSKTQEPRHLSSWGSYLSDLPQSEKPRETFVAARQPAYSAPQQDAATGQVAENDDLGDTAESPQAAPNSAKQSRLAKLVALSPDKESTVKPALRQPKKLGTAKPASPTVSERSRANAQHKESAPVLVSDLDAKVSARGVKRRGLGLFLFGRHHANQQAATQATVARD